MPDTLRHHYTEGQRAVLCIIAGEVKHHGYCDLPIDKIVTVKEGAGIVPRVFPRISGPK